MKWTDEACAILPLILVVDDTPQNLDLLDAAAHEPGLRGCDAHGRRGGARAGERRSRPT